MENEETPIIIALLITFISVFIGIGYWWGSSNVPEPEINTVKESIIYQREQCDKLGGIFTATIYFGEVTNILCKIPANGIEI